MPIDSNIISYIDTNWRTGDVITEQGMKNINNALTAITQELNNAIRGQIVQNEQHDTLSRRIDGIVKYFLQQPNPNSDELKYARFYAVHNSEEEEIVVPKWSEYLEFTNNFKRNFVQPYSKNNAYSTKQYIQYNANIYKVIIPISAQTSAENDAAAWAIISSLEPSPIKQINILQELGSLINIYNNQNELTDEQNKIWIQNGGEEVQIPTYEEFNELKTAIPGILNVESFADEINQKKYHIEKGYYEISSGNLENGTAYAYSNKLSKFSGRTVYAIIGENYNFAVRMWNENGKFEFNKNTDYIKNALIYVPEGYTIAFNFRNNNKTTMNAEDYDAISNSFHLYTIGNQYEDTTLNTEVDFNTLIKSGNYRFPSNQTGINTNQPTNEWGRLVVINSKNDAACVQIYFSYKGRIFTRIKTNVTNDTWTDWVQYNDTIFKNRTPIYNQQNKIDFNLMIKQGRYGLSSAQASAAENSPSDYEGHLLTFAGDIYLQIYVNQYNTVYYRTYRHNTWSEWLRPLKPDESLSISGAAADAKVTGGLYFHNGECLRMSSAPEAIPVGENHLGYNDFIAATWDTLLPNNYQPGDEYNENTTKLLNVHVERVSNWTSTPYGENVDTYPIYRYVLTPRYGYKRTALLTSGCHGNEAEGYWGLYRLIRMIFEEGYKYPTLRNLRDIRFIIIPSWNPWGMQHYRRYNAFSALNTGSTDVAKNLQAWNWLWAENNQITVNGVAYNISDVGEASVIKDTLDDYAGEISLWLDFHTDPYAGRITSVGEIDDPRGSTDPYGFYGFAKNNSVAAQRLKLVIEDFYSILKNEYNFTQRWYLRTPGTNPATSGFSGYMASQPFPTALLEVSTFMNNFPHASGSTQMMKLVQEYYANCLADMIGI